MMNMQKSIWILSEGRKGDLDQMQALAAALDWPAEVKQLVFRKPAIPALARQLLNEKASSRLAAPFPDLIFCAEAMTTQLAIHLRNKSNGVAKIICIGRPAGHPAAFDLILTTAQYRLPPRKNIVSLSLPLIGKMPLHNHPKKSKTIKSVVVLVGAASFPDRLDEVIASHMARDVMAKYNDAALHFVTSPRTPVSISLALQETIMPPHKLLIFSPSQPNPYRELIAQADEIIVTSDSISMVIDAVSAAKPTRVFRLPRHQSVIHRIMEWCQNNVLAYDPRPIWSKPFAWLFDRGFIETTADRPAFFESLIAQKRLDWFGEAHSTFTLKPPDDETSRAAEAVRGIFTT